MPLTPPTPLEHKLEKKNTLILLFAIKLSTPAQGLRFSLLCFFSWRRETLVKGVGPGGLLGDVVYVTPCGRQVWNIESVREVSSIINSFLSHIIAHSAFTTS